MKFFALSVTALVFLALGVIASACGDDGGGGLSLEEYFQQADELQNQADAQFAEQESGSEPEAGATDAELADFARQSIESSTDILSDAAEAFGDLDPPSEVEDAHARLVEALSDGADAIQAVADDLPDALSMADLEGLDARFDSEGLNDAFMRLDEACVDLQTIADDNSIDVDLECGEAEE